MIRLGNLIRRVFPHRAWPYPRGEREIRQVIVATLFLVFALLVCMIAGLKYEDEKTLRSRDVYFAAKSITSYTSEARLIAANLEGQSFVGPYREVYIKQLARNVSDSKDRLATHQAADEIQSQVVTLMDICDQLNDILNTFSRRSDDRTLAKYATELQALTWQAKAIEESL